MNAIKSLAVVSFCFLTACTVSQKPAEQLPVNKVMPLEKRQAETATVSSFEIHGALAAKSKSKGWTATMNWAQVGPSSYQIRLMGPLGSGAVMVSRQGQIVTLKDGNKTSTSSNADELLLQQTGIRLPVNNLYYWVRGLPAPGGVESEQHDKYNHLTELKQNGYSIHFTQFTSVKGIDLPSMIRLEGNGIMVKVVIKSWGI